MATLPELMREDPKVDGIVRNDTLGHQAALAAIEGLGYVTSDTAIRRARKSIDWVREEAVYAPEQNDREAVVGSGKAEETSYGVTFQGVTLPVNCDKAGDWTPVFEIFQMDPTQFEIVGDTVKVSTWQQSKGLDTGERDVVRLWAHSARFRRRTAPAVSEDALEGRRARVLQWSPLPRKTLGSGLGPASTLVVCWADWQLGKGEGGGVYATESRVLDSFEQTIRRFEDLRRIGRNIEGIATVNMGDPTEGCSGNYANQTFTTELTQRQQILLALDLFEQGVLTMASMVDTFDFVSTLCNHGEWTRGDSGKAVTDDSDNVSGFLTDALQRVLKHRSDMSHINWHIPHDEMITTARLSGVWNAFTHGHKTPSGTLKAEEDWLSKQTVNLLLERGERPRLWTTAHKHHSNVVDLGPYWRIQCSALDGGSKWLKDANGKWSSPGTTTYLAGTHDPRGFSDWAVL